jgi:serine/threonine protein kinase/Flp pilus assembly protein TadD
MSDASVRESMGAESLVADVTDEFMERVRRGERPDIEDYARRHPQIASVLRHVLPALEVIGSRESGWPSGPSTAHAELEPEGPLGDFRLVREIGRGGMGVVYKAVQISLGREVALKVLPFAAALDAKQLQRFKNEAQAAAHLHHTNIVPVYGIGCERGVHYYAMQYIDGQTVAAIIADLRRLSGRDADTKHDPDGPAAEVTKDLASGRWAPANRAKECLAGSATVAPAAAPSAQAGTGISSGGARPIAVASTEPSTRTPAYFRSIANLGMQAAQALEHAHAMGVIHRDIKPANLIVDLRGNLWITDFGLARLQDNGELTVTGDLVGTLRYMSPEQALAQRVGVDHRTDLYSLGMTLYELMTLEPAFGSHDRGELLRQIAFEEPRRPQLKNTALPTDLETIVLKAIEKNPNERYTTAQELADDLERFLGDKPIRARRPSLLDRAAKLARRHRTAVWSAGISLAVLLLMAVAGLATSNVLITHERNQKGAALKERERALADAEANLTLAREAVDEMYTRVADELSGQPHMQPFRRDVLQKALGFYQRFAQRKGGAPALRLDTALAALRVAQIQHDLGQRRQAKQVCEEVVATLEALVAELPREPRRRALLGHAYRLSADILSEASRRQQAEQRCRQALAIYRDLSAEQRDSTQYYRTNLAEAHQALGRLLAYHPREAEEAFREACKLCQELVADGRDQTTCRGHLILSYRSLGQFLANQGRLEEAETAFRQAIDGIDQLGGSVDRWGWRRTRENYQFELSRVLGDSGRLEAAETAYRQAMADTEINRAQFSDRWEYRLELASHLAQRAVFLNQTARQDEAAALCRSACELFATLEAGSRGDAEQLGYLHVASDYLRKAGDLESAERFGRKAVDLAAKLATEEPDEPGFRQRVAEGLGRLGSVLHRRGRLSEAADQHRQAVVIHERLAAEFPEEPAHRFQQAASLNSEGIALRYLHGEAAAAVSCHQRALRLCETLVVEFPDQPMCRTELVRSHFSLGIVLRLIDRNAEAVRSLEQAMDAYRSDVAAPYGRTQFASVHNELAWLLATCLDLKFRDPGRALALARKAVELEPAHAGFWNTLGVACRRAGDDRGAIAALEKSEELGHGRDFGFNAFFLAMARWQLGERDLARKWYGQAVEWMEKRKPNDDELRRFRAEAEEMLQIKDRAQPDKKTGPR